MNNVNVRLNKMKSCIHLSPEDDMDLYEKTYMRGDDALARSRAGLPWAFHLILGVACLVLARAAFVHPSVGIVGLPVLLLTWLLFMYVRVTVTADAVHVQLGVFGPEIPVADIVEVSAETYPLMKYGGWGLRFALDGSVAYSVPGYGRGVRIRFTKKNGRESTAWVTSPEPERIVAAIEQARATKGLRGERSVRLAASGADPEELDEHAAAARRPPGAR
jgi:hypothetical protein